MSEAPRAGRGGALRGVVMGAVVHRRVGEERPVELEHQRRALGRVGWGVASRRVWDWEVHCLLSTVLSWAMASQQRWESRVASLEKQVKVLLVVGRVVSPPSVVQRLPPSEGTAGLKVRWWVVTMDVVTQQAWPFVVLLLAFSPLLVVVAPVALEGVLACLVLAQSPLEAVTLLVEGRSVVMALPGVLLGGRLRG